MELSPQTTSPGHQTRAARACYAQKDPFGSPQPMPPAPALPKRTRFGDQTRCRPRLLRPSGSVLITKPDATRACYAQMEFKMPPDGVKMSQDGAKIAQDDLEMVPNGAKMSKMASR